MKLVCVIRGILGDAVNLEWEDSFDSWMTYRDAAIKVLKKEYEAPATPRINTFIRDPKLARSTYNEIVAFIDDARKAQQPEPEIWLVCHSNGVIIGIDTAQLLVAAGHKIAGMILVGGAANSDVKKNGLYDLVYAPAAKAYVNKVFAFANKGDNTVPHRPDADEPGGWNWIKLWSWKILGWPYGGMGHEGLMLNGKPYTSALMQTNWYPPTYGHSGYWAQANMTNTFEDIYDIIRGQR